MSAANVWALILAAGEGSRLRGLTTTPGGLSVPKQFCSLQGGASLLEETLYRAESVAQRRHMVTVVAAQHRRWWEAPLWSAEPENVIVQPENKGHCTGSLASPAAHRTTRAERHRRGASLGSFRALGKRARARTAASGTAGPRSITNTYTCSAWCPMKSIRSWATSCRTIGSPCAAASVRQFIEKPSVDVARDLVQDGALWNVFILAASARALLGLYASRYPGLVADMSRAVEQDGRRIDGCKSSARSVSAASDPGFLPRCSPRPGVSAARAHRARLRLERSRNAAAGGRNLEPDRRRNRTRRKTRVIPRI